MLARPACSFHPVHEHAENFHLVALPQRAAVSQRANRIYRNANFFQLGGDCSG